MATTVFVVLLLGVGFPGKAQAQETQRITFNEAIQMALERNISLQQSANSVELQSTNLFSERADFLPSISLSSGTGRRYGRSFDQVEGAVTSRTINSFDAGVSSNINVFNGFGDVASMRQARHALDASDFSYERQRQTVVFNVMSTYLSLIEQREQVRIQEENLEAQQQQLTQIEEFTRVGSRPISDLFQQQAQVAQTELTLLNARRSQQITESNMIQLLQLDPFGTYEFESPSIEEGDLVEEQYNVRTILQNAFDRRYDLKAQEASIDAAQSGVRAARSGYWPSLSFRASTGSSFTDASEVTFDDQFLDRNRSTSLGFNLSLPVFDRFATRTNVQRAKVQLSNARLELDGMEQRIAVEVRQAYLDYQTAEKQLDVTEAQLRAAEQALEAAQERYNVGATTLVELTQAQADYVQAESDRASATYNFLFQKKLIDYYVGVLDPSGPLFE